MLQKKLFNKFVLLLFTPKKKNTISNLHLFLYISNTCHSCCHFSASLSKPSAYLYCYSHHRILRLALKFTRITEEEDGEQQQSTIILAIQ
jgi:hypothetical protein